MNEDYQGQLSYIIANLGEHLMMKVGILMNVTKWALTTVMLLSLKREDARQRLIYIVLIVTWSLVAVIIIASIGEEFFYNDLFGQICGVISKFIITLVPIFAYPIIYYLIRRHYMSLMN